MGATHMHSVHQRWIERRHGIDSMQRLQLDVPQLLLASRLPADLCIKCRRVQCSCMQSQPTCEQSARPYHKGGLPLGLRVPPKSLGCTETRSPAGSLRVPADRTHRHIVSSALLRHIVEPQLFQPLLGCFEGLTLLLEGVDATKPPASFLRQPLVPVWTSMDL